MPAISFTAPEISEEEERKERAALTNEERQRLQDDLYGTGGVFETEEMRQSAAGRLQQAMMLMPVEQKCDYLEALERVPELVVKESPALAFMRCENYDATVSLAGS